jgi:tetratricopeptide (TPR) repeat protein/DNA-binding XRE family transcriptional regulator
VLAVAEGAGAGGATKRARLAARRRALGLTQEDLATLLGIERSTVVRWEAGATEPLPWIRPRLALALQVPAAQLAELLGSVPVGPYGQGPPAAPVPRQVPAAVTGFTGRASELAALTKMRERAGAGAPGTVVISAIGGTAGVGKTALALYWAHQVADRFADGQLYVNLRGFDPAGIPVTPAQAIRGFLDALGVPPGRIPAQPDAQAGLYRSLMTDRAMLIVLDNARDEQQVRPLLPASPASLVLVTSRHQLAGLAADGARLLNLDVLTHGEAVQLLTARLGEARAAAEPDAVAAIAALCAGLPLALAVTAARAAARPGFPLAVLAAELRDTAGRLDALDAGDPAASVRAVFSWSYRQLSPGSARLFRLLGLHPGPDISVPAAASLTDTAEPETCHLLRELTRGCLIAEHVPGRYGFHDLLRAYAAAQARDTETEADREAATGRALDHYLHTAGHASTRLNNSREPITLTPPRPGTTPERPAAYQQALAWFEAEHQVLLAAIALADSTRFDVHAWQLTWAMKPFLEIRGHYQEAAAIERTALAAATRLDDVTAQATFTRTLGSTCTELGDLDQARAHLARSLDLYRRLGNHLGEANAYLDLGKLAARQGRYVRALGHAEQALRLYQAVGHKAGEARMLNNVGYYHALIGNHQAARAFCRQAVNLCVEVGHPRLVGHAWDSLGYAEHQLGNYDQALDCYQRALRISDETSDRHLEATTLIHLGGTRRALGELPQAHQVWRHALAILEDLQHPDADQVRAKLDNADEAGRLDAGHSCDLGTAT